MGKGDSKQTTTPVNKEHLKRVGDIAYGTYSGEGFYDPQLFGGMETRAGITPEQQALQDRMTGATDLAMTGLEQTLGPYDPNNPALTGAIDMATADIARGLKENELIDISQGATSAGQFGSSRQGVAEGIAKRGAAEAMGDVATQMRLADMQQFETNQQAALQNLSGLTQGIEYAGGGAQREEQAQIDDMFRRWEYESGVDLQNLQTYRNLASGDWGGKVVTEGGK